MIRKVSSSEFNRRQGTFMENVSRGDIYIITQWERDHVVMVPPDQFYWWQNEEAPRCPECDKPLPLDGFPRHVTLAPQSIEVVCPDGHKAVLERTVVPQIRVKEPR